MGIRIARGPYLAFLDDDDLYLPTKLAEQLDFLQANPDVDLVAAGAYLIDERGNVWREWRPWTSVPDLSLERCLYSCPLAPSLVLLRRQVLEGLTEWFDVEMDLAEDTDFFIRLLHAGIRMAWLPKLLTAYRVHSGSSQGDGARYTQGSLRVLDKLFDHTDVPPAILGQRNGLYAHRLLSGACLSYSTGHITAAQQYLEQALDLQPDLAHGVLPEFAARVADFANSIHVSEPTAYIDNVYSNLPPSLSCVRRLRHAAQSASHMKRVFAAHRSGEPVSLRDWLVGVWYAPGWLRNSGIWSIMAEAVLGSSATDRLRATYASIRRLFRSSCILGDS